MKTESEIQEILKKAEDEIQEICSKYGVTLINNGRLSLVLYDSRARIGETQVAFAPF